MDATFRPRKSDFSTMLVLLPLFLAWGGVTLGVAAYGPGIRSRPGFAALALVPLGMAGLCAAEAVRHSRSSLTIRGGRVDARGLLGRSGMGLAGVTEARWGPGPVVKLRDGSSRLRIDLRGYERPDRERIAAHLHATIRPEAQHGWDLFAYKTRLGLPEERTPGPGEVLRTRRDSLRLYLAVVAASAPLVALAAWATGRPSALLAIPALAALVAAFSFATPAEGAVEKAMTGRDGSELAWFLARGLAWGGFSLGLWAAIGGAWRGAPPAVLYVGTLAVFLAGLLPMASRMDRRSRARDEEAAGRAAAARGESGFPSQRPRL